MNAAMLNTSLKYGNSRSVEDLVEGIYFFMIVPSYDQINNNPKFFLMMIIQAKKKWEGAENGDYLYSTDRGLCSLLRLGTKMAILDSEFLYKNKGIFFFFL